MMRRVRLSLAEARRIALCAQGFDRPRPAGQPDRRHFGRVFDALKVLQLDFVNVLLPAHFLVVWSRLGAYDRERFHDYVYGNGRYTEHWAHEASIIPARYWPLLHYRREGYRSWKSSPTRRLADRETYLDAMLERIRDEGCLTTSDFEPLVREIVHAARRPGDWHRSIARHLLEDLFGVGRLSVADRREGFRRAYDLPSRVLPDHHALPPEPTEDAQRKLLRDASEALGVATAADLADYFRMPMPIARPRIAELVEAGDLRPIHVEAWADDAYLAAGVKLPRRIGGASLLSPFDPLVWFRPRLERLFEFHYRLEIYVPESKRRWGYYVLPFRLGDRLVARVDLKADRRERCLLVRRAHVEPNADPAAAAEPLAAELGALAEWLSLDRVRVSRHNSFSRTLSRYTGPSMKTAQRAMET